ncbi:hypothetical protein N9165_02580 [Akkermansiaceae bacterium]|nr:hypothetical protein [Akkermansiaceae bacterium]
MIYKQYTGVEMFEMPVGVVRLGEIITHYRTRTLTTTWYSDDAEADAPLLEMEQARSNEFNKTTTPSMWQ